MICAIDVYWQNKIFLRSELCTTEWFFFFSTWLKYLKRQYLKLIDDKKKDTNQVFLQRMDVFESMVQKTRFIFPLACLNVCYNRKNICAQNYDDWMQRPMYNYKWFIYQICWYFDLPIITTQKVGEMWSIFVWNFLYSEVFLIHERKHPFHNPWLLFRS